MKRDMDEAVERVLAGLRETELPEGLEQRVSVGMRARSEADVPRRFAPWWMWTAAAIFVAVVAWPVASRIRHQEDAVVAEWPVPKSTAAKRPQELPQQVDTGRAQAKAVEAQVKVMPVRPRRVEVLSEVASRNSRLSESDLRALEDMRTPSRPAVPEPLTAQEKRLLYVAVQGTEEQRAALNPVVREAQYQEAKKAVMEFFEPPKPAEQVQE